MGPARQAWPGPLTWGRNLGAHLCLGACFQQLLTPGWLGAWMGPRKQALSPPRGLRNRATFPSSPPLGITREGRWDLELLLLKSCHEPSSQLSPGGPDPLLHLTPPPLEPEAGFKSTLCPSTVTLGSDFLSLSLSSYGLARGLLDEALTRCQTGGQDPPRTSVAPSTLPSGRWAHRFPCPVSPVSSGSSTWGSLRHWWLLTDWPRCLLLQGQEESGPEMVPGYCPDRPTDRLSDSVLQGPAAAKGWARVSLGHTCPQVRARLIAHLP